MKAVSGREFARLLEQHGWTFLRVRGSHHVYSKPGSIVRISVPIHGNRDLKIGLLTHLLKMAELSEKDL